MRLNKFDYYIGWSPDFLQIIRLADQLELSLIYKPKALTEKEKVDKFCTSGLPRTIGVSHLYPA